VGCVLSGAIRFQVIGEPARVLAPGDAFFEPAHAEIAHFDNASEDEPAVFVAFYLLEPGETTLIEMLS
jgi:quercetin dioxygenase-like cupin family protein